MGLSGLGFLARSAHQKPVLLQKGRRGRRARAASTSTRCGASARALGVASSAASSVSRGVRERGARMVGWARGRTVAAGPEGCLCSESRGLRGAEPFHLRVARHVTAAACSRNLGGAGLARGGAGEGAGIGGGPRWALACATWVAAPSSTGAFSAEVRLCADASRRSAAPSRGLF